MILNYFCSCAARLCFTVFSCLGNLTEFGLDMSDWHQIALPWPIFWHSFKNNHISFKVRNWKGDLWGCFQGLDIFEVTFLWLWKGSAQRFLVGHFSDSMEQEHGWRHLLWFESFRWKDGYIMYDPYCSCFFKTILASCFIPSILFLTDLFFLGYWIPQLYSLLSRAPSISGESLLLPLLKRVPLTAVINGITVS